MPKSPGLSPALRLLAWWYGGPGTNRLSKERASLPETGTSGDFHQSMELGCRLFKSLQGQIFPYFASLNPH